MKQPYKITMFFVCLPISASETLDQFSCIGTGVVCGAYSSALLFNVPHLEIKNLVVLQTFVVGVILTTLTVLL
jgi:hypothetical protein